MATCAGAAGLPFTPSMRRFRIHPAIVSFAVAGAVLLVSQTALAAGKDSFQASFDRGWLWLHLAAFGFGFLTSLTPCVYPMIPIVVGIFGGKDTKSRSHAFALATVYVLGMGLMFSTLGVVFALAVGQQSNQLLANPYVVIPMVIIYAALAASMFGAFELALPYALQQRLNRVGGSGYRGAFGMGLVGGLTAAPCTGPFLLGLLGFIATRGNVIGGMSVMMAYAIGLGILFWVIAVFAVSLPKSGRWMEWVKSFGGLALLVMGVYFLRPIWPWLRHVTRPSWAFLGIAAAVSIAGLAAGAIHRSFHGKTRDKVFKGIGVALAVVGLSLVVGWIITPNRELAWRTDENAAFAEAQKADKLVMIDFGAEWCVPCKKVEKIFADEKVYPVITDNFIPLRFDVTETSDENDALMKRFGAGAFPTVIFFSADHRELGRFTNKNATADGFRKTLDAIIAQTGAPTP